MRKAVVILQICFIISCDNPTNHTKKLHKQEPSYSGTELVMDSTIHPCRQFRHLKSAEAYFQSANNRTKGCAFDSLTHVVAAKEYSLAIDLDPNYWQARRNYARQLIYLQQFDLAIEQLNTAIKLTSPKVAGELYAMRGQVWYEKGAYASTISDCDLALNLMGRNDYLLLYKAKALWKMGQMDKACQTYQRAISGTPSLKKKKEFIICKE